jgi:hypothetical protein
MRSTILTVAELALNFVRQDYYRDRYVMLIVSPVADFLDTLKEHLPEIHQQITESVSPTFFVDPLILEFDTLEELSVNAKKIGTVLSNAAYFAYARGIEVGTNTYWDDQMTEATLAKAKPPVYLEIQRSRHSLPVIGVGGGSACNTFAGRWVLNARRKLKRALFVHKTGNLSNSTCQAIVPVAVHDIIVTASGNRPLALDNPDVRIRAYKVLVVMDTKVEAEDISDRVDMSFIPKSVAQGCQTYHNRDGEPFCSGLAPRSDNTEERPEQQHAENNS